MKKIDPLLRNCPRRIAAVFRQIHKVITQLEIGDTVDVCVLGIYPVIAGGSVSRKNLITSGGTDGTAVAESASTGTNVAVLGQAIEDGSSGDRVATIINPFIKQGG